MSNSFADLIKTVAPALATALGGPLAGAAVGFIASKLGVDPAVVEQTVAGMTPADLVKMKEMDLDFQKFMAENSIKLDLAQIQANAVEATSANWFVAGWRPFVGWTCGVGLAYVAIVEPVARFVALMSGYAGIFPLIDTSLTMQVLLGMLGLAGMRSYEKGKGTAGSH